MKIRLVVALVGLAISFALPTFAQQTNTPDPQLRQKLIAAIKKHTDALDKNDAAAVAANFTEDGILITPDGPIFGRESIEKYYVGLFKQIQLSNNLARSMMILRTLLVRLEMRCGQPEDIVRLSKARTSVR